MKLIDIKNESQADPFIFEANGKFYVYATGRKGVALSRPGLPNRRSDGRLEH